MTGHLVCADLPLGFLRWQLAKPVFQVDGMPMYLSPPNAVVRRRPGDR